MKLFLSSALKVLINSFRFVWDNTILVSSANKTTAKTVDELTMLLIFKKVMDPILNPVEVHVRRFAQLYTYLLFIRIAQ